MNKNTSKEKIRKLVLRFESQIKEYKKKTYDEDQVKVDFITPFFEALGWDVSNKSGESEFFRDVVVQDRI